MENFDHLLSKVNERSKASVIRELLKLTNIPGLISFAGGMPDPSAFPVDDIIACGQKVLKAAPATVLQYGATEGYAPLIAQIIKLLKQDEGLDLGPENILVTSASQQALDIVSKAFIDEGDAVLVANPTYLGALQAFRAYGADMIGADSDDYGLLPSSLEQKLQQLKAAGRQCKFIYVVPDFQNPTGTTIPAGRRIEILNLAKKYNTVILEDSPYRQIRFKGEHQPTFYALDKGEGNVITMFTFSKTFVPGLRLGYIVGSADIIRRFCVLKQAMDLCTPPLCQAIAAQYLEEGKIHAHVAKIVGIYTQKLDAMLAALAKYMPPGVSWTRPEGGLFLWVTLPAHINATKMFPLAVEEKVAYVVGSAFYAAEDTHNCMRLNFSYATFEQIEEGTQRLAAAIKRNI